MAWLLESCCVGCLGHGRGLPLGSQPSLQRIQRLRSDFDMGKQSIGSREIDRRQLESSLEFRHRWRISRFCCRKRRLAVLNERVSGSSVVDSTVFQSGVRERAYH
jgi:ABC-type Na+ transport system ATPase subunit NatA